MKTLKYVLLSPDTSLHKNICYKLFHIDISNGLTVWFWRSKDKYNQIYHARSVYFKWYRKTWKANNVKPMYRITNNGAKRKNKDSCFDMNIYIGYLIISYTNWNFNRKR